MIGDLAAWLYGQVWPNLVASGICAVLVWWRVRARMILHHAAAVAVAEEHHLKQLAAIGRLHPSGGTTTTDTSPREDQT